MKFNEYLRNARRARSMTIRELASRCGLSHAYLSQVENARRGVPKPDILRRLAEALRIDYAEMLRAAGYFTDQDIAKRQISLEEALQQLLNSPFVMFNGLPVGEFDEETKEDLIAIARVVLERRARQKAAQEASLHPKKEAAAAEASARAKRSALPLAAAV